MQKNSDIENMGGKSVDFSELCREAKNCKVHLSTKDLDQAIIVGLVFSASDTGSDFNFAQAVETECAEFRKIHLQSTSVFLDFSCFSPTSRVSSYLLLPEYAPTAARANFAITLEMFFPWSF